MPKLSSNNRKKNHTIIQPSKNDNVFITSSQQLSKYIM